MEAARLQIPGFQQQTGPSTPKKLPLRADAALPHRPPSQSSLYLLQMYTLALLFEGRACDGRGLNAAISHSHRNKWFLPGLNPQGRLRGYPWGPLPPHCSPGESLPPAGGGTPSRGLLVKLGASNWEECLLKGLFSLLQPSYLSLGRLWLQFFHGTAFGATDKVVDRQRQIRHVKNPSGPEVAAPSEAHLEGPDGLRLYNSSSLACGVLCRPHAGSLGLAARLDNCYLLFHLLNADTQSYVIHKQW